MLDKKQQRPQYKFSAVRASFAHVRSAETLRCLVADGHEEAFKVAAALVLQGVLQRHVVLLQIHVLDGLQIVLLTTRKRGQALCILESLY